MVLPTSTHPLIARFLTSESFERLQQQTARAVEKISGGDATLRFFHDPGCARSWLLTEALIAFSHHYDVTIIPHLVTGPTAPFVRDLAAYYQFSFRDAHIQAKYYGLTVPQRQPTTGEIRTIYLDLLHNADRPDWLRYAQHLGESLFCGTAIPEHHDLSDALPSDNPLLHQLGNYRGGTMFTQGTWFFGVDRLSRVEQKLASAGCGRGHALMHHEQAFEPIYDDALRFYFSFRSPFSYLALPRVLQMATDYGLTLDICPVFNAEKEREPAPLRKQLNLLLDAAREGRAQRIHFGRVTALTRDTHEQLTAIFYGLATSPRRQRRFLHATMRAIWARGDNFDDTDTWRRIREEARLSPDEVRGFSKDRSWLQSAHAHSNHLEQMGHLDVPAFEIGRTLYWGYDRLTQLEAQLAAR